MSDHGPGRIGDEDGVLFIKGRQPIQVAGVERFLERSVNF
jgi:hypothetical protein